MVVCDISMDIVSNSRFVCSCLFQRLHRMGINKYNGYSFALCNKSFISLNSRVVGSHRCKSLKLADN